MLIERDILEGIIADRPCSTSGGEHRHIELAGQRF
jgi:hypothetical protein